MTESARPDRPSDSMVSAAPIGPCAGCGKPVPGEHIAGTVYGFSCDECDQQINDDFEALMDRVIRGDLDD